MASYDVDEVMLAKIPPFAIYLLFFFFLTGEEPWWVLAAEMR